MYPRNKQSALVSTLEHENAIRELSRTSFRRWMPHAKAAVLPDALTAAGELPPNPQGIVSITSLWMDLIADILGYGAELLYAREILTTYLALGGVLADLEPVTDPEVDPDSSEARRRDARKIVAQAIGETPEYVRDLDRSTAGNPEMAQLRATYRADLTPRLATFPDAVFNAVQSVLDSGAEDARLQVETVMRPVYWDPTAERNARTETAGSQSLATIEAAQLRNAEIGEDLEQTWICTLDSKTRKTHWAADGQRVPLGGKFSVGRAELRGPGDPRGPVGETANCRCRVGILAADESLPDESDRHTERAGIDVTTVRNRGGRSQADEIARRAEEGNIRAREDPDGLGRVASAQPTEENPMEYRTFTDAVVAVLGVPTDDRRLLAADIDFRFREFPLPVMWTRQSGVGHMDAFTVGVIEDARVDGDKVLASGYLLNTPEADEAAEQLGHGVTGPSVDLGDVEWKMTDEDGNELSEDDIWAAWDSGEDVKVFETLTSAKLLGFTLVSTPAFGETWLKLDDGLTEKGGAEAVVASLVASAGTVTRPSAALFANPNLDGPTLPTYDEDTGRFYGHLACFNTCHVGITDRCVTAPRTAVEYAHFLTSPPVRTADGVDQRVGRLTAGTGHAGPRLGARPAAEHYDNTGTCFALVNVGEDDHGIWFSGVRAPGITDDQFAAGISAPLSGDWRAMGGNLELVAALAVNTPGFPIIASGASDEDDAPLSLVAAIGPRPERKGRGVTASATAIAREVVREMRAQDRRNEEAAALVASVQDRRRAQARAIIEKVGN
jgi:hypothetical protein